MSQFNQRVLFISHDASRTGAPLFLLNFLRWLRRLDRIPFEVLITSPGELLPDFESLGRTHVLRPHSSFDGVHRRLRLPAKNNSRHLALLKKSLAQTDIGLIYANTMATGQALDYLSFLDCPVICHVHELEQAIQHCNRQGGVSLVKARASSYIAVSHAIKRNLVVNHGVAEDKVSVVHGFIPTGRRQQSESDGIRAIIRRELKIPADALIVCACGSVELRKGPDLFLQVADTLGKTHPRVSVHFVWIGGSKESVRGMRSQVEKLSLQNVVHFIGSQPDTSSYYEAADIFLLPSREDPFPLVMMEAALHGNPVVCFDNAGGAPEFVQHDAGFVVPAFDVSEMASKVALLLMSDDLRQRMGEAGKQRVLRHHDINTSAPKIAAIIQSALGASERLEERQYTWLQPES